MGRYATIPCIDKSRTHQRTRVRRVVPRLMSCSAPKSASSPRIYVYSLPKSVVRPCNDWRNTCSLAQWIRKSKHFEPNGECADYFLVPHHPTGGNPTGSEAAGDYAVGRMFDYIRQTWPFWNRSVADATARHFWLLPCDHGPGDCAFSRPIVPNKYSSGKLTPRRPVRFGPVQAPANDRWLRDAWGEGWEALNPASPARLLFNLQYNGWTDGLRSPSGSCLNCFQPWLDVRLPTPEEHECGPLCGLHRSQSGQRVPTLLQRELLRVSSPRAQPPQPQPQQVKVAQPAPPQPALPRGRRRSSPAAGSSAGAGRLLARHLSESSRGGEGGAAEQVSLDCVPYGRARFDVPSAEGRRLELAGAAGPLGKLRDFLRRAGSWRNRSTRGRRLDSSRNLLGALAP